MDESELVARVAASLRADGWVVLVARPSQIRFHFTMQNGRRKAPDLIAYKSGGVMVAEAKCVSSQLFSSAAGGYSDFACLSELLIESVYRDFIATISARLARLGIATTEPLGLTLALISSSGFSEKQRDQSSGFIKITSGANAPVEFS